MKTTLKPKLSSITNALLAVSLLIAIAACSKPDEAELLSSTESLLARNDAAGALIQARAALQANPASGQGRVLLARTLLDLGQPDAAWVELTKAEELGQPIEVLAPVMARSLVGSRQWQRLLDKLGQVQLRDAASQAQVRTAVATAYASLGQRAQARSELQSALAVSPAHLPALLLDVRIDLIEIGPDIASSRLESIAKRHPEDADVLQLQGDLRLPSDAGAAAGLYRRSLAVRPDNIAAHIGLTSALLELSDLDGLQAHVAEMRRRLPNRVLPDFAEAQLAYARGEDARASELILRVLAEAGDSVEALNLAGAIDYRRRSFRQAEVLLSRSLSIAPRADQTRFLLAATYLRLGNPERAVEVINPLMKEGRATHEAWAIRGEALMLMGQATAAQESFNQANRLRPGDSNIETVEAIAEIRAGTAQPGLRRLESIAVRSKESYADMALIAERMRRGEFSLAMQAVDRLEQKSSDKGPVHGLRGQLLFESGDIVAARREFEAAIAINADDFLARAGAAACDLQTGDMPAAKRRFTELLTTAPQDYRALLALADIAGKAGDPPADRLALIRRAVAAHPGGAAPKVSLVSHFLSTGAVADALSEAQGAAAAFPESVEVLNLLGRSQLASKEIQQAMLTFGRVVGLAAESPLGHLGLADAQLALNNRRAALSSLRRALAVSPGLLTAQLGIVRLESSDRRWAPALTMARQIQSERPQAFLGFLLEGDIETLRANREAAIAPYREASKRGASTEVAAKLHATYSATKRNDEAQRFASEWLAAHPQDAAFTFIVGERALMAGDLAAAERYFSRVVDLKPNDPLALNNLAWLKLKTSPREAVALATRAKVIVPDVSQVQHTLALALEQMGDLSGAATALARAVELAPENAVYRLELAKLHLARGDRDSARLELQRLSRQGGRFESQAEVQALLKTLQ